VGHGRDRTKVPKNQQLAISTWPLNNMGGTRFPGQMLSAECQVLVYRAELAAIFFTMASTSLRSLSLRLTL
jgi:hypothetical protein